MKKLFIISAIAVSGLIYNTANAQTGFRFGFNFHPRRVVYATAPQVIDQAQVYQNAAQVYENGDDYYYLPDLGVYYDVTDKCYFYFDGNNWISCAYLPGAYRDFDWRAARRFEIREHCAYLNDDVYRARFNGNRFQGWANPGYYNHYAGGYANQAYKGDFRHFDRDRGGFIPPAPYNKPDNRNFDRANGAYNQPAPLNRDNGRNFDDRNNGFNNQKYDDKQRDYRGGNEHFVKNNHQVMFANHKMAKF